MAGKRTKAPHFLMVNDQSWDRSRVIDVLCGAIASSSSGIATILAAGYQGHPLPSYSTVALWLSTDTELSERYARAKEAQAEHMGEEMLDIADSATNDWMETNDPDNPGYRANGELVQRSRLRIDTRKWLMGKLKPKKYGDSTRLEHVGKVSLEHLVAGSNDSTE